MQVRIEVLSDILGSLIPYDMLISAFSEAEEFLSNDVAFRISAKCQSVDKCVITEFKLIFKYDYVNNSVLRAFLEVYLSPEITVGEFFGSLSQVISDFRGDFELRREGVKVAFNLSASKLGDVFNIINSLKESLNLDFKLNAEGYEVLVTDER